VSQRWTATRLFDAVGRPEVVGGLLIALAIVAALDAFTTDSSLRHMIRIGAVGVIFATLAFALRLVASPGSWSTALERSLVRAGWLDRVALPIFDEELSESGRVAVESARRSRGMIWVASSIAVIALGTSLALFARVLPSGNHGEVSLVPGASVDAYVAQRGAVGARIHAGHQLRLRSVVQDDAGRPVAHIEHTNVEDGSHTTYALNPRGTLQIAHLSYTWRGVFPTAGIQSAQLRAVSRASGEVYELFVRRNESVSIDGSTQIVLVDSRLSYLGQLGPALLIRELRGGETVREEWIFVRGARFDLDHGSGAFALEVLDFDLQRGVVLGVIDGPPGWLDLPLVSLFVIVALGIATFWRARRVFVVVGRSGDYFVLSVGLGVARGDAWSWACAEVLTPSQVEELAALHRVVRGEVAT